MEPMLLAPPTRDIWPTGGVIAIRREALAEAGAQFFFGKE
jgi:hypothetical protein